MDPLEKFWKIPLVAPRESILPTPMITAVLSSILHPFYSSEAVMGLDYQILLKSPPLTLLAGSALHADNAKLNENLWWKAQTAKLCFRKQNTKESLLCYWKKWVILKHWFGNRNLRTLTSNSRFDCSRNDSCSTLIFWNFTYYKSIKWNTDYQSNRSMAMPNRTLS